MKKIILAIDIQNEYITPGSPFNIKDIKGSLNNIKKIMETGRKFNIPVWHMKHEQEKNVFRKGTELSNYIKDFEPQSDEFQFTKDMYSCFNSYAFSKQLSEVKPDEIIIVGYGSSMCCTCTIIDGIHRGYRFTLIQDATASRSFPHATEDEMHQSAINVLTQYAQIKNTNDFIAELSC